MKKLSSTVNRKDIDISSLERLMGIVQVSIHEYLIINIQIRDACNNRHATLI